MWLLILFAGAATGIAYLIQRAIREPETPDEPNAPAPDGRQLPSESTGKPRAQPAPSSGAWDGWIWPVTTANGRTPVITQEWKPGHDPIPGHASSAHANHLGVDIMYRKLATDPAGTVPHDASRAFIAPEGTKVLAAGPGKIWNVHHSDFYGTSVTIDHGGHPAVGGRVTFYQHLASLARDWKKGDEVRAGDELGDMGYAPGDPEGLRHLHFELWFPHKDTPALTWRVDPAPYMKRWPKVPQQEAPTVAGLGGRYQRGSYRRPS